MYTVFIYSKMRKLRNEKNDLAHSMILLPSTFAYCARRFAVLDKFEMA